LASSIRTQGIIQPLIVRVRPAGGYELIAGERRWRAAQRAGLHEVPAVIRDVAPAQAFEMALVENLQREDLNPIEEASGYERLVAEFGYTQEKLAERVGKERSTVANALRLLRLPDSVRGLVAAGRLSMGHARALLGVESTAAMERLARRTVAQDLSVRKVEELVRRDRGDAGGGAAAKTATATGRPSANARDLGMRLSRALGTRVDVNEAGPGRGQVAIHYQSLDQLDALIERIVSPRVK
jgi:ParB family chromosome partitioning protein